MFKMLDNYTGIADKIVYCVWVGLGTTDNRQSKVGRVWDSVERSRSVHQVGLIFNSLTRRLTYLQIAALAASG